jgi:hypothetical protein
LPAAIDLAALHFWLKAVWCIDGADVFSESAPFVFASGVNARVLRANFVSKIEIFAPYFAGGF